ncbi:MAG: hypothetical protein E7672_09080 [Ruminococcaceae bacterium]|nr:hypothetical protein [Oscillospiraceae bacterium]
MFYNGKYITGKGDKEKLDLIEKSFAMLNTTPVLPNLKMLYTSQCDSFCEGFIWGPAWWIQNSYGFTMGAVPMMSELWMNILQNSYDRFWVRMGDCKRVGADDGNPTCAVEALCAPDGALGDCVDDRRIVYRQGDGDFMLYDWFYEGTAAGVNMQCDILLFDRRPEQLRKYIPLLWRSLNHIELTRAENDLFLVGMCCNLLAPSYGGSFNEETGEIGKGYLTGISITYSSALKKFIEVLKMAGDEEGVRECQARLDRNLAALPQLLTEEGYLVKSMDPDGTKHGVFGEKKYGYFEAVCNVDAIAWEIVNRDVAESIYKKIASIPQLRSAGVICNNYPHLDDTMHSYRNRSSGPDSFGYFPSGNWVDGGCWATVEGRAILAYQKLGKYVDSFRAARAYMRWAEEYRQDAPLCQWGWNTNNQWSDEDNGYIHCGRPVAVMIDNFAAVTCLLRGLFDYTADADGLRIRIQIPEDITELIQHEPVRFSGCSIYISYKGGDGPITASLNGKLLTADENGYIFIPADLFAGKREVSLSIDCSADAEEIDVRNLKREEEITGDIDGVPEDIAAIYRECSDMLENVSDSKYIEHLREIMLSVEDAAMRRRLPFDKHDLRPMTQEKIDGIIDAYDRTVRELYNGLRFRDVSCGK